MAVVGLVIGVLYLASFPALGMSSKLEVTRFVEGKAKSESRPGETFFFRGLSLQSRAWELKRLALFNGEASAVELSHAELNAWLEYQFRPVAVPAATESQTNLLIIPGVPNVYMGTEIVYLSFPTKLVLYGSRHDYTIICAFKIMDIAGVNQFRLVSLNIESAGIPFAGYLGQKIVDTLLQAYSGSDEFASMQNAWARVDSVRQFEGGIRLTLR